MNEQQAREFVEMLAVPEAADPPPCPLCGDRHELEARCFEAASFAVGRSFSIR
jgi:hypothetical protein